MNVANIQEKRAFSKLVEFIQQRFANDENCVMSMTRVDTFVRGAARREGIETENNRAYLLKTRLIHQLQLGDTISFHRPHKRNESQYVFSSSVNLGPLIERYLQLEAAKQRKECGVEDRDTDDIPRFSAEDNLRSSDVLCLYNAALLLRKNILSMKEHATLFSPTPRRSS